MDTFDKKKHILMYDDWDIWKPVPSSVGLSFLTSPQPYIYVKTKSI